MNSFHDALVSSVGVLSIGHRGTYVSIHEPEEEFPWPFWLSVSECYSDVRLVIMGNILVLPFLPS